MTLNWTPVTARVLVAAVEPHRVNVGLIVGENEAMLIDSGNDAAQGAAILESAGAVAGVPVTRVALTHHHDDHVGGLAGMPGLEAIAHEHLDSDAITRRFSMALAVDLGGQRVELLHFGDAHTRSDVVVFVPGENVVFAGDLLEEGADPQVDESSSLSNWPTVLDGVLGATNDRTLFVPGHGAAMDRDVAFVQRAEIAMLYSQTEMLIQQGVSVEDAASATEWPFGAETLATALPKAYDELAARGITPKRQLPISALAPRSGT
ncbi:MBL fold metallo-hydrolase [Tessaracoccus flavus]|uniref:Metallo-beta-lactamase domain-containing protein n=1 Tax=Tessaracoccus flavus TaxID=1610493 RepID=A0A1Q2CDP3_9ACTN|nr:MBL fold metallo-hydrolase [Tessaracoccus flavus]AQP44243.1 hypothetical protein RPIT_04960 [Tessaracoccus flavus]SDY39338.1 Glyoxylase, beta-lactamase superfamily II [Tessaracoccus flavus]